MQYFKPLLGKALTVKGLYPPNAEISAPAPTAKTEQESEVEARSIKLTPATKKATTTTTTTTMSPPAIRVARAAPELPEGTTDDTPDFNRDQVMLDIPDQLFGNSFTIVTNVSKIFGDFMMVSSSNEYQIFKSIEILTMN